MPALVRSRGKHNLGKINNYLFPEKKFSRKIEDPESRNSRFLTFFCLRDDSATLVFERTELYIPSRDTQTHPNLIASLTNDNAELELPLGKDGRVIGLLIVKHLSLMSSDIAIPQHC